MICWNRCPIFFYSIALLSAIFLFFNYTWLPLVLGISAGLYVRIFGFYLILFFMLIYLNLVCTTLPVATSGKGYLELHNSFLSYGKYVGHGRLWVKNGSNVVQGNVICKLPSKLKIGDYLVTGNLKENQFFLDQFTKVADGSYICKWRLFFKKECKKWLVQKFSTREVVDLFSALIVGDCSKELRFHFNKSGLGHLLSISGFHFGLILLLWGSLTKWVKDSIRIPFLLVVSLFYFLLVGPYPSVLRAWIMSTVYMVMGDKSNGLNILGISLSIALLLDPTVIFNSGFQLSYLSTFAILTLYRYLVWGCKARYHKIWYYRYWFFIFHYLRNAFLLNFSVAIFAFPIVLFHYWHFPLISVLLNLFIPLFVALSLLGLLISLFLPFVPVVEEFTKLWLNLLYCGLGKLEIIVIYGSLPNMVFVNYLLFICCLGFYLDCWRYRLTQTDMVYKIPG